MITLPINYPKPNFVGKAVPADTPCTLDTLLPLDVTVCIQYPLWGEMPNFPPFIQ